ncbi:MarR family winged helix-turn-helix transcriptional regulator [Camelimonas abortus]|uniref:MarR family winged helix-turn-helix transcriptional regulator n=1 Tax=Camelimonas abortus TaxID=1017184 RepID=A0ABV7LED8_9HYPH
MTRPDTPATREGRNVGEARIQQITPDHDINNRLFFRLCQAANQYERTANRELNISAIQGIVLGALSRYMPDGIAFSSFVDYIAVSRQNLDAVLKRLEKLGLVERVENPRDRRVRMVRLTPEGVKAWETLGARTVEFFRLAAHGVSQDEKIAFTNTLVKITRNLRNMRMPDNDGGA